MKTFLGPDEEVKQGSVRIKGGSITYSGNASIKINGIEQTDKNSEERKALKALLDMSEEEWAVILKKAEEKENNG